MADNQQQQPGNQPASQSAQGAEAQPAPQVDPRVAVEPRRLEKSLTVDPRQTVDPRVLRYNEEGNPLKYDKK